MALTLPPFDMETSEFIVQSLKDVRDKVEQILVQTTKTNGRVDRLEEWKSKAEPKIEDLSDSHNKTKGRDAVIWVVICVGAIVAWEFIKKHVLKM